MNYIYVSTDVETDGPIPGDYSMLGFGSAAYSADGTMISSFTRNLECLPDAKVHPKTQEFWTKHPQAWKDCRTDLRDPAAAMKEYFTWLHQLPGTPIFVGYPASFDFMFVYWYLIHFMGESPFGFQALDIKSCASIILNLPFKQTVKKNMPKTWFTPDHRHTHRALDYAIEQGELFFRMLAETRYKP